MQVIAHGDHILRISGIHFVDHKHIRHTHVGFAGIVTQLMSRPVRISNHDKHIGHIEGEVVVTAIPQHNIDLLFRFTQDRFVVHACVHDNAVVEVGFVFLAFLNGAFVLVEIAVIGKALNLLFDQVAIGHGMPDGSHCITHLAQDQ